MTLTSVLAGMYLAANSMISPLECTKLQDYKPDYRLVQAETSETKPITLESFLTVTYEKTNSLDLMPTSEPTALDEIHHYHQGTIATMKDGKFTYEKIPFLESVVVHIAGSSKTKKKVHVLADMNPYTKPNPLPKYFVMMEEGSDKALVYDPNNLFDEGHLKRKIQIHLESQKKPPKT